MPRQRMAATAAPPSGAGVPYDEQSSTRISPLKVSGQNIAASPLSLSSPGRHASRGTMLELLIRGEGQTVEIPRAVILEKVMKSLPGKKGPVYHWAASGPSDFQVCVELDCTGTRVSVEPRVDVPRVFGDVCSSPREAHLNAVLKCFVYLEKKHFIRVTDYSSLEAEDYEDKEVFGYVNDCSYSLEKVLREWSVALDVIGKFRSELATYERRETVDGVISAAGAVYSEMKNFVGSAITKYIDKHRVAYLELREYENRRKRYLDESSEKTNAYILKGFRQKVHFSAKDVLDEVVKTLGLKCPEYSNEVLRKCRLFRGEVTIWLPEIEAASCGGNTKFKGIDLSGAELAEESAAIEALHYLEEELNVTVVDKNFEERVEAKERHMAITRLLAKFLELADNIIKEWSYMIEYINAGVDIFGGDVQGCRCVNYTASEQAAMKFCAEGIAKLHSDCVRPYEAVADKIKSMAKFRRALNDLDD